MAEKIMRGSPSICRIIATLRAYHTQSYLTPFLLFIEAGGENCRGRGKPGKKRSVVFSEIIKRIVSKIMTKIARLFVILLVAGLVTGVVFLTTWNIPAPSAQVEKVIPDDEFPR